MAVWVGYIEIIRGSGICMVGSANNPDTAERSYAELHCLSNFSFLRGASHPHELVHQAQELGYRALAITDECSVAGVVRAYEAARKHAIKLIIGSEFRLDDELLVLLAPDRRGYAQLCTLISHCRRQADKGNYRIQWSDIDNQSGINLDHCLLLYRPDPALKQAQQRLPWLAQQFPGRCWLLVERLLQADDEFHYQQRLQLATALQLPVVCANNVHMHLPQRQRLQDLLTAIRHRSSIEQCGFHLASNAERHLRSLNKIHSLYDQSLIDETLVIAERCQFCLSELRYEYPAELVPAGVTAGAQLRKLVEAGARQRFIDGPSARLRNQIEHELKLIAELNYEHYFLTIEDIVRFARSQNILCQGRGSAANSIVCYCLHITEVDPREVSLLVERFISKERDEPPDIDVDFEHERREEVIQYIYHRYGRERAGLTATVISYRAKSAIRDVGKALAMDESHLAWLISQLDRRDGRQSWQQQLLQLGGDNPDQRHRLLVDLVAEILDIPRHLSQHVGGFVISAGPLSELVPIENAAMVGRTVIQWNKDDLETLGLLKVDILALGMLTAIRKTLDLLNQAPDASEPLRIQDIPREDPVTYEMLCQADSMGVFQVESRAQMSMLPRLKPRNYYDLVVEVAIVRPGPIQGDMVHPFLRRREGSETVDYPSPEVRAVLERTLGVPIFQEQVIKLAMVAAGFTGGEADKLRRAMTAWRRNGYIQQYQQKLVNGMLERGYPLEFAQRICRQIEGFGEYGFPESHAASFALLVYISAWLKCHQPAAFCCGLLNSQPMGFYTPSQLVQDARRHGVEVRTLDINHSHWDCTLEYTGADNNDSDDKADSFRTQGAIRLGLRLVKGLSKEAVEQLQKQRPETGFGSVADARQRCRLKRNDWDALAAAGAFKTLCKHRYQARWELLEDITTLELNEDRLITTSLAHSADSQLAEPKANYRTQVQLKAPCEQDDLEEDFQHMGLSLGRHPLALLRERGLLNDCVCATELQRYRHGQLVKVAGLVTNRQRPRTASGVTFVTLEDESGAINLVVWRATAQAQRHALLTARILKVSGIMEKQGGVIHVIAGRLTDISEHWQAIKVKSRDFC
ncbi:MAG: error-prone DNA polymerase [Motiliproteus sp.]